MLYVVQALTDMSRGLSLRQAAGALHRALRKVAPGTCVNANTCKHSAPRAQNLA